MRAPLLNHTQMAQEAAYALNLQHQRLLLTSGLYGVVAAAVQSHPQYTELHDFVLGTFWDVWTKVGKELACCVLL
jgi:hypothetical protein